MKTTKQNIIWAIILTAVLIIFLATGCKTKTVLVPVDRVKIEYKERLRVDSVYNRDTLKLYQSGDTILIEKIKWREKFKFDTLRIVKTDSIPYPVEVVKEVNKLTRWQRWRLNALNVLVLIIVVYLVIRIKL